MKICRSKNTGSEWRGGYNFLRFSLYFLKISIIVFPSKHRILN